MSTITKISATYSRLVKPDGDFTHREASATIEVAAEDLESGDIQTQLDEAMSEAHDIVHRYIGVGMGSERGRSADEHAAREIPGVKSSSSTKPPATKGSISEDPENRTDPDADEAPKETAAAKKKRVAAEKRAAKKAEKEAAEAAEADDDGDFDFDDDADADAPDEITDDDLQKAANAVVVRLQQEGLEGKAAPKAVSKVIAGFKPDDHEGKFGISMLKQKARRKFIEMIDALEGPDAD